MESDQPLSPLRTAARDTRLEGLWCADDGKERFYFYLSYGASAEGSLVAFSSDEKGMSMLSSSFFVTQTPRNNYLNVRNNIQLNKGKAQVVHDKTYTFMQYRFDWRNRLVLSIVGGDAFARAIKERKLRGKVDGFSITISHEPVGRLLQFIENSEPKQVFFPFLTANKIGNR